MDTRIERYSSVLINLRCRRYTVTLVTTNGKPNGVIEKQQVRSEIMQLIIEVLRTFGFFTVVSMLAVIVPASFVVPAYLMGVDRMLKDGLIRQDVVDEHVGDWKSMIVGLIMFSITGGVVVTILVYLRPLLY